LLSVIKQLSDAWKILTDATNATGTQIQKTIDGSVMAVQKLTTALGSGVTGSLNKVLVGLGLVEDKSHKNSVFPDMVDWADKTADAIGGITSASQVLGSALVSVNQNLTATVQEQMASWNNLTASMAQNQAVAASSVAMRYNSDQAMQQRDFLMRQQYGQMWSEAMMQHPGSTTPAQAGGSTSGGIGTSSGEGGFGGVNITINAGASVLDDRSMQQFAGAITRTIQENQSSVIGGR